MPTIDELLAKLGDSDPAVAHKAYRDLENVATRAGDPARDGRAEIAAKLAAALHARGKPKKDKNGKEKPGDLIHPTAVRNQITRLLSYVAGAKEVPALCELIDDLELREMARFALDRNTSPEATEALINGLEEIGPDFRVGVVNALGKRKCPKALAALRKAAEDSDKPVRIAAVEALANFPEPANDAIIARAAKSDCCSCRKRARKARLRLAEALAKAGKKSAARRIYQAIANGDANCPQTKAARMALKAG